MIQYNQRRRQIGLNVLVGHQNNIKLSYPIHVLSIFYGRELDFERDVLPWKLGKCVRQYVE